MQSTIQKIELGKLAGIKNTLPFHNPFESIEYLKAMEDSQSASEQSGWIPEHLGKIESGQLVGLLPLYKKFNSYGEFIFDHQWANALQQAGRNYYPKLLTAVPFTPCEGDRILGNTDTNKIELIDACIDKLKTEQIESWHVLFPNNAGKKILEQKELIERFNYRFVWRNNKYATFTDFLSIFTSRQRATIRKERQSIEKIGITFRCKKADEVTLEDWDIFYPFYQQTYLERGQSPYLKRDFFYQINTSNQKLKPLIFFAYQDGIPIAASLCFEGRNTLYGRHWGALTKVKNLHFECCYYQGIDYCINN
ncbi:MAG: GNAT family N-acetyltransferase, partial [Proteobacteria bacterium]|nr:GNAT family N-acetyltransferase [Pseudomonadota bacterium]